ncbi:hypothetical protein MFUR16E_04650 [Methylobacterium fujisawaense]|uniref:DUF2493 domain-containing protein n=1 Tax=Methylobacterium fujisawaense TaxID=107400 RepID=UPI002F336198
MKLLVCGGRDFDRKGVIWDALDDLHRRDPVALVITGAAPGADTQADRWAAARGLDRIIVPANWTGRGKAAGPVRNELMLSMGKPDRVLAFPGGIGTASMCRLAEKAGVRVERSGW